MSPYIPGTLCNLRVGRVVIRVRTAGRLLQRNGTLGRRICCYPADGGGLVRRSGWVTRRFTPARPERLTPVR